MQCTALLCRAAASAVVAASAAAAQPRDAAYANAIVHALLATSRNSSSHPRTAATALRSPVTTTTTATTTTPIVSLPPARARRMSAAIAPTTTHAHAHSLATFCPGIASMWLAAASSKLLQPHHVRPDSRKLAWWCCASCRHQFNKRIDRHVADGGVCPRCAAKPPLLPSTQQQHATMTTRRKKAGRPSARRAGARARLATAAVATRAQRHTGAAAAAATLGVVSPLHTVVHRCRPDNSRGTLDAPNANRVKASVADGHYLRVQEQRNLLPMLAKNYEHEQHKIAARELLHVSPKLDGVRCIVAYDRQQQRVLFFSRSGTLFECCDVAIEPALRYAFACDPTLVLDGELYNDSANMAQLCTALGLHGSRHRRQQHEEVLRTRPLLQQLLQSSSSSLLSSSSSATARSFVTFEQLASAVRTTRERRTPAVAALQARLQLHVFDVLYAAALPRGGCGHVASYTQRYAYLTQLLDKLHAHNRAVATRTASAYDATVVRLLPQLRCVKADVPAALRDAMLVGYEGVMVRRTGVCIDDDNDQSEASSAARSSRRLRGSGSARAGEVCDGYAYGQRSSMLLKYKRMCDDEFVIVSALEGKGKWRGCLGAFVCTTRDRKHTFTVAPASTDGEKRRMWRCWRSAYLGKVLTVQYQELTPDGVPRFPVAKCVRGAPSGKDWI